MDPLIQRKSINSIESYVVLDKPVVTAGSQVKAKLLFLNTSCCRRKIRVKVIYRWRESSSDTIFSKEVLLNGNKTRVIEVDLPLREHVGKHVITLFVEGKRVDETSFIVTEKVPRPALFTIVWHHHQAPNYTPDGRIHSPWAYVYVWGRYLTPYGYGPYHYHSVLLMKKPGFKSTYNLSPSLLKQWAIVIDRGVVFTSGKRIDPDSHEALLVKETLDNYRKAVFRGQIDVLSSIYAHTIAGFLTDVIDATDIVEEEIRYGKEVTREVIGKDYDAKGFWTPEMAFSMKLIPLYSRNDIEYTILDGKHHFEGARGNKHHIYEPYIVVDNSTGSSLIVFFRDHELSNMLSFMSNFYSEPHAWRNAYELVYRITEKLLEYKARVMVLALDGENWMIFSKNPPLTAYFLDKLTDYLIELSKDKVIMSTTLQDITRLSPPEKKIEYIPTNTWLGSFRKWRGEKNDHERYWVKVVERYRLLKIYEEIVGGIDESSREARQALWHALDSDYWWAEFWNPTVIDMWLKKFDKIILPRIKQIRIRDVVIEDKPMENSTVPVKVSIENDLERDVKLLLRTIGVGLKLIGEDRVKLVKIKAKTVVEETIKIQASTYGRKLLMVSITVGGYTIDYRINELNVFPTIPANPA